MGAKLVGQAFSYDAHPRTPTLKPNEIRLLLWMSLHALDGDRQPRYFMSREESAFGLGRALEAGDNPDAAFQRVKVAVRGLVDANAIRRVRRGREGQRAEYELTFPRILTDLLLGTDSDPLESTGSDPFEYVKQPRWRSQNVPPRNHLREQENSEESPRYPAAPHLVPVDNYKFKFKEAV